MSQVMKGLEIVKDASMRREALCIKCQLLVGTIYVNAQTHVDFALQTAYT